MDLEQLIEALSRPAAYPHPVDRVEVRQTHISAVFLAGPWVYKLKKPVDLGFLDYHSLERRRHFCEEETRLNLRLAGSVYHGVLPIVATAAGVRVGGDGLAIDYVVRMTRLPDEAELRTRLRRDQLDRTLVIDVARRIAEFHASAGGSEAISAQGRFARVERSVLDNFTVARPQIGNTVSLDVFEWVHSLTVVALQRARTLIAERAERGVPRDLHGDLRLEHVYYFPDRAPPDDLVIIDCIEFSSRLRQIDPVADMAFLAMDLAFRGRRDLARAFTDAYFEAHDDPDGRELLPLYLGYRSLVRAKVDGLTMSAPALPPDERDALTERATAHWLFALGELAPPIGRPALILVGGLPGTGKSTLARRLAARFGATVISSDPVRKALAGLEPLESGRDAPGQSLYTEAWTERTYAACLERATRAITDGGRVVVDATFGDDARRRTFLEAARRLGVRGLFLECQAQEATIRARLAARQGDASDADFAVYARARERWQGATPAVDRARHVVVSDDDRSAVEDRAVELLSAAGLA